MSSSNPKRSFVSGRRNDDFCGRFFIPSICEVVSEVLFWDRDLYVHVTVNNNIHVTMCRRFDLGPGSRHQREAGSGVKDSCCTRRGWVRWDEELALVWWSWGAMRGSLQSTRKNCRKNECERQCQKLMMSSGSRLSRCWLVQKCCRWHKNHHKGATTSPNILTH